MVSNLAKVLYPATGFTREVLRQVSGHRDLFAEAVHLEQRLPALG